MALRGLFVDFDGTICDTESAARTAWVELYDELHVPFPPDLWPGVAGRVDGHRLVAADLAARTGRLLTAAELARRLRRKAELAATEPARPGVAALLSQAALHGVVVAVVSNSAEHWVDGHLRRLGLSDQVDRIVAGGSTRPKPAPDLYLDALALTGVTGAEAVAVEDSVSGIEAARGAGLWCLGVGDPTALRHADAVRASLQGVSTRTLALLAGKEPAPCLTR